MTMPHRRGQRLGGQGAGAGRRGGFGARRLVELQQQRLHFRLEWLAQRQARLTSRLEQLQERVAAETPKTRRHAGSEAPAAGRRAARGGRQESPFSGRTPPHGESVGREAQTTGQQTEEGPGGAEETPEKADEGEDRLPSDGGVIEAPAAEAEADEGEFRAALFDVFDALVDRDNPALPRIGDINAALDPRIGPVRRWQAEPVYREWLARGA